LSYNKVQLQYTVLLKSLKSDIIFLKYLDIPAESLLFRKMYSISDMINFQYYIEVVPTVIEGYLGQKVTYQYSVKVRGGGYAPENDSIVGVVDFSKNGSGSDHNGKRLRHRLSRKRAARSPEHNSFSLFGFLFGHACFQLSCNVFKSEPELAPEPPHKASSHFMQNPRLRRC